MGWSGGKLRIVVSKLSEFFVGIEFGRERPEIRVESFVVSPKLTHGEGSGLERVEPPGLQSEIESEMDGRVWRQSAVLINSSLDGKL